jgi:hypothetical protein
LIDDINREVFEVPLELDVYGRLMKDSEGNDIQVFIKEDKKNGIRRDSIFYHDGSWEMVETNDAERIIKSKTSFGTKIIRLHDTQWHLTNKTITDKNGDTLTSERYIWQNGRLVKMIQNGLERKFFYGKTLQDTIKVIPSDEGLYFHPGYNNSVGMMPNEKGPAYKYFSMDPYGKVYVRDNRTLLKYHTVQSIYALILQKQRNKNNPMYRVAIEYPNKKVTKYYNPIIEEIPVNWGMRDFPTMEEIVDGKKRFITTNGRVAFDPDIRSSCISDGCGKFKITYPSTVIISALEILQSILEYNVYTHDWDRICRTGNSIQRVYEHEAQHIFNAENWLDIYPEMYFSKRTFDSKEQCERELSIMDKLLFVQWLIWKDREFDHDNSNSPSSSGDMSGVSC